MLVHVAYAGLFGIETNHRESTAGEGTLRQIAGAGLQREGQSERVADGVHVGKREHVKDAEPRTNRGSAASRGIPGEADARIKILAGRVGSPKRLHRRSSAAEKVGNHAESVMGFGRQGQELIAHTEIERQVGADLPVILEVAAEQAVAAARWWAGPAGSPPATGN